MSGPDSDRSRLLAALDPPLRVVDRRPERPRGALPLRPRVARACMLGVLGLLLAAVIQIIIIINESGSTSDGRAVLLATSFALAAAGLAVAGGQRVAAICGLPLVAWTLAGLGIGAALGWWMLLFGTVGADFWWDDDAMPWFLATASGTATVAWVVGNIGVLQLGVPTISTGVRRFRRIAVGVLAFAGGCIITATWIGFLSMLVRPDSGPSPSVEVLLIILSMVGGWGFVLGLALCGSATAVGHRMERTRSRRSETVEADVALRFACPGCGEVAERTRGLHRCTACGTRVRVRIEEPRCPCGYAVFRLPGDRCPECGAKVPHADRYSVRRFDAGAGDAAVAAVRPEARPQASPDVAAPASPPADTDSSTAADPSAD